MDSRSPPRLPGVSAAVLVGGRSRRMGQTKALLPLGDGTVLDRLLEAVSIAGLAPIALVGHSGETADYARFGLPIVLDHPERPRSVLAGLEAALTWSPTSRILVVACDTPFVPPALLARLARPDPDHDVTCAAGTRGPEPLLAVYSEACLAPIARAFLSAGDLRAIAFHGEVRVHTLDGADQRALDPEGRAGWNLNEPGDYERARRLLGGEGGSHSMLAEPPGCR